MRLHNRRRKYITEAETSSRNWRTGGIRLVLMAYLWKAIGIVSILCYIIQSNRGIQSYWQQGVQTSFRTDDVLLCLHTIRISFNRLKEHV